jgi:hypothetical protein
MKWNIRMLSYVLMVLGAAGFLSFSLLVPAVTKLSFLSWLVAVVGVALYAYDFIKIMMKKK